MSWREGRYVPLGTRGKITQAVKLCLGDTHHRVPEGKLLSVNTISCYIRTYTYAVEWCPATVCYEQERVGMCLRQWLLRWHAIASIWACVRFSLHAANNKWSASKHTKKKALKVQSEDNTFYHSSSATTFTCDNTAALLYWESAEHMLARLQIHHRKLPKEHRHPLNPTAHKCAYVTL